MGGSIRLEWVAALNRNTQDVSKEAQSAVKASVDPVIQSLSGVVAAANQAEAKLNRAVAAFGRRWLMLASVWGSYHIAVKTAIFVGMNYPHQRMRK